MSDFYLFLLKKIQFTYSLIAMFIFLSIVFSLSYELENYIFAASFVFFFILSDLLERGVQKKYLPIAISSLILTTAVYLFLAKSHSHLVFKPISIANLALFYFTIIFSVSFRISRRNPFFGIRTSFTLSNNDSWMLTHEIASKLLFFSLFPYLGLFIINDSFFIHFLFFGLNILLSAYLSLKLAKKIRFILKNTPNAPSWP